MSSDSLRDRLIAAFLRVPVDAPAAEYATDALPVVAEWLRAEAAELRKRPYRGPSLYAYPTPDHDPAYLRRLAQAVALEERAKRLADHHLAKTTGGTDG